MIDGLAGERGPPPRGGSATPSCSRATSIGRLDVVGVARNDDARRARPGTWRRRSSRGGWIPDRSGRLRGFRAERALEVVHARHYTRWSGTRPTGTIAGGGPPPRVQPHPAPRPAVVDADAARRRRASRSSSSTARPPSTSHDVIGKKILVLRFQASYCQPCAKESPGLLAHLRSLRAARRRGARGARPGTPRPTRRPSCGSTNPPIRSRSIRS